MILSLNGHSEIADEAEAAIAIGAQRGRKKGCSLMTLLFCIKFYSNLKSIPRIVFQHF